MIKLKKTTLIIIPAYNEEDNIVRVVTELVQNYPQYDYVVVNDGSRDGTAALCREHEFCLVDLPVNLGLAGAVQAGMRYADKYGYDAALQFDADGQHQAEYIASMADKLNEGYNIVIGSRFCNEKKPFTARMMGSFLISFAIRLTTGKKLTDPTSGMRMYDRVMVHEFATQMNHAPEPDTIAYLMRKGAKIAEVQVVMSERISGTSYLNFSRSISYMLRMAVSILLVQWFRGGTKAFQKRLEGKTNVY